MDLTEPLGCRGGHDCTHERLKERAVGRQTYFRYPSRGGEAPFIGSVVAAKRVDVVEGPRLAPHNPIASDELGTRRIVGFQLKDGLVETRGQNIDQVDVAGKLAVLLARHAGRNEDSQVTDRLVDGVDDRLSVRADLFDVLVKVRDPSKRLLRRRDV